MGCIRKNVLPINVHWLLCNFLKWSQDITFYSLLQSNDLVIQVQAAGWTTMIKQQSCTTTTSFKLSRLLPFSMDLRSTWSCDRNKMIIWMCCLQILIFFNLTFINCFKVATQDTTNAPFLLNSHPLDKIQVSWLQRFEYTTFQDRLGVIIIVLDPKLWFRRVTMKGFFSHNTASLFYNKCVKVLDAFWNSFCMCFCRVTQWDTRGVVKRLYDCV